MLTRGWVCAVVGHWVALSNQPTFTANAMMLMTDGTVMVQDVATAKWWRLSPDASGSYVNGAWSPRADGPNGPTYFASAVLRDGRVLIAGGEDNFDNNGVDLDAADIYDPASDSWTTISTPGWGWIGDAPGCLLPDGRFLMGSINDQRTAIYDPTSNSWSDGPNKGDPSSEETWTLLPEGTVLCADVDAHPAAEKYVISTNGWTAAGAVPAAADLVMQDAASIEIGPAILMNDGRVFATGASGHTAIYTPGAVDTDPGSWAAGPDFPVDGSGNPQRAFDAPAVLLPNGRVLCIAGPGEADGWAGTPSHAFEFDGTTFTAAPDPPNGANADTWELRLLLLPTGEVLCSSRSADMQVYQPDGAPDPAWEPTIVSAPTSIQPGTTFTMSGYQLNGLSQANSYGDDAQMATNYPIVRLEIGAQVFYCRTHSFSTMGVATGTELVSVDVDVPSVIPLGDGQLCVVANGIPTCTSVEVTNLPGTGAGCTSPPEPRWLPRDACLEFYEYRYLSVPISRESITSVAETVASDSYLEFRVTYEHELCPQGKQQGPLLYTLSLLPGETQKLYHSDRYRRVTTAQDRYSVQTTFMQFLSVVQQAQANNTIDVLSQQLESATRGSGDSGGGFFGGLFGLFGLGSGSSDSSSQSSSGASSIAVHTASDQFYQSAQQASLLTHAERSIVVSSYEETDTLDVTVRTLENLNQCRTVNYFVRQVLELYKVSTVVVDLSFRIIAPNIASDWHEITDTAWLPETIQQEIVTVLPTLPKVGENVIRPRFVSMPTDGVVYDPELAACCSCEPERAARIEIELDRERLALAAQQQRIEERGLELKRRQLLLDAGNLAPFEPEAPSAAE